MHFSQTDEDVAHLLKHPSTLALPGEGETPPAGRGATARAVIPASAGELVQGRLENGEDFLVTNPIARFSEVQVSVLEGSGIMRISPADRVKIQRTVLATLALFHKDHTHLDVDVQVRSDIPLGKGLASSTADIVAAAEATAAALGCFITPEQISAIAISIEPSDGIMHRGIVSYNHREGKLLEYLGPVPAMQQLILDIGGVVDTIEFNRLPKQYTSADVAQIAQALELIKDGIQTANLAKIGLGSTMSALVNQRFLPKQDLDTLIHLAWRCGAYGVICAHSGTILSLLFHPQDAQGIEQALSLLQSTCYSPFQTCSVCSW